MGDGQSRAEHSAAHRAVIGLRNLGLVQHPLRLRARRRLAHLRRGAVTVVVVSWNSNDFLTVALSAVRRFADRPVDVVVIDNNSRTSPRSLTRQAQARLWRLPLNTGHSMGLDIGFLTSRNQYTVALDVDAFPISEGWLPALLEPLEHGKTVVGCDWRGYAHPCCLAMSTERFVLGCHTFAADSRHGWDVGEGISRLEGPERVHLLAKSGGVGGAGGLVGATYAGVVYHNAYGTRHLRSRAPEAARLDSSGFTRKEALATWEQALKLYGPSTWDGETSRLGGRGHR